MYTWQYQRSCNGLQCSEILWVFNTVKQKIPQSTNFCVCMAYGGALALQRYRPAQVPQLLLQQAYGCERDGACSAALAAFSAAADGLALQIEAIESLPFCPTERDGRCLAEEQRSSGSDAEWRKPAHRISLAQLKQRQMLECLQGKARCSLEAGELQKGLQLAGDLDDPRVYRQCADILLRLQHHRHAAALLHRAGDTERAAALYIQVGIPSQSGV